MIKSKMSIIMIVFLIILPNFQVQSIKNRDEILNFASIIYVDDDNSAGPWDGSIDHPFKTINDAVLNSTEGDAIFVFNGIYYENIIINKRINIIGEGNVVIDAIYNDSVITIDHDNVVLKDLIIRNSGGFRGNCGLLINSDNNLVINCEIYRTRIGVFIKGGNTNEIKNTTFYSNGEGIRIESSEDVEIKDCVFYHNSFASEIHHSRGITIDNCYYHTNGIGLLLNDSSYTNISKCAFYNNNDNEGGIVMFFCKYISVHNSNFEHNGFGICINYCSDIYITSSDFVLQEHEAFWIRAGSENINIENCEIYNNVRFGVLIYNSKCTLKNNNFYNNLLGFYIEKSYCDARRNWWGCSFGPAIFERNIRDRIFVILSRIRFSPWLIKKNENAGSDWSIDYNRWPMKFNNSRYEQIRFLENDSDCDGVPDWWEEKYGYDPLCFDNHADLDPDNDGLNNIEECYTDQWGSNPFKKDLFIEVDYFDSEANKPTDHWINKMKEVFSKNGINLHIDVGQLGGGELISYNRDLQYEDLNDVYWDYFLHNDLNNPRKGIFHYCFIKDYGPSPGFDGFSIFGWDNLDSWVIFPSEIKDKYKTIKRDFIIIAVIMHELGHTLGLFVDDHGGIDNMITTIPFTKQFFKYSTYRSCMNYMYTYKVLDYSHGKLGKNDYDDWSNLDFYFFKNSSFNLSTS